MKKITFLSTTVLLTTSLFLAGCSEAIHRPTYQMNEVGRTNKINEVYITRIHKVHIDIQELLQMVQPLENLLEELVVLFLETLPKVQSLVP